MLAKVSELYDSMKLTMATKLLSLHGQIERLVLVFVKRPY